MENVRVLALVHEFLKHELRESRTKLSDERLAELLNTAQHGGRAAIPINLYRIGQIRRGAWPVSNSEISRLLNACKKILADKGLEFPKTAWLEDTYGAGLNFPNRNHDQHQGPTSDALGELAEILSGAWTFSYLSPIDRERHLDMQIRTTALIFSAAQPDDKSMGLYLISGHGVWTGKAFLNDQHVYLTASDPVQNETAFFLINRPGKSAPKIVGVGAALERTRHKIAIRSVLGVVCFGEKWRASDDKETNKIQSAVEQFRRGEEITDEMAKTVRDAFCSTLAMPDFRKKYPTLNAHIKTVKINGKSGIFDGAWLYLSYI